MIIFRKIKVKLIHFEILLETVKQDLEIFEN